MIKNKEIVVLVHGIFDVGKVFNKMSDAIIKNGYTVLTPTLLPNNGKVGLDDLAVQLNNYIERNIPESTMFYLVGFSMGGLICRYYLQKLDGIKRVKKFITLSSPHYGSMLAFLVFNKGCRQMRPESDFINELNNDIFLLEKVSVVSIWTPFDLCIIPPRSSSLPIGKEIKLNIICQPLMLKSKKSIETVIKELKN
jgi:triacylglycerol lipase